MTVIHLLLSRLTDDILSIMYSDHSTWAGTNVYHTMMLVTDNKLQCNSISMVSTRLVWSCSLLDPFRVVSCALYVISNAYYSCYK